MELMIAIAIIAILTAVALPNLIAFRMNSQFRAAAQDVYATLQKAKMEAIKQNVNCTIAFNQMIGGITYDYIVFNDTVLVDGNYTAGERLVVTGSLSNYGSARFDPAQGGGSGTTFTGGPGVGFVFGNDGLPRTLAGAPDSGSIFLTDDSGRQAEVQVNTTGFIRIN